MTKELVICGASLGDGICQSEEPPEELLGLITAAFVDGYEHYRVGPVVENEGTDEEEDHREDGTFREMPRPIRTKDYLIRGAYICYGCYCALAILSPSGRGLTHELGPAIEKARSIDGADLPRIG